MTEHASARAVESLEQWKTLAQPRYANLIEHASTIDPHDAAALTRLRKLWPAELVRLAVELVEARRKAADKFGEDRAQHMMCDVPGVEQATSRQVARHKARRFAAWPPARIVDLCCGIGGDTMALSAVAPTLAVDRNPVRAWMAAANANCAYEAADAESVDLRGAAVHIDPARRTEGAGGRRRWRYEEYQPGPAFLAALVEQQYPLSIKLGPGVDIDALPLREQSELEFISERGTLVQAVLWSGMTVLHPGQRTATTFPRGASFTGEPDIHVATDDFSDYVYTIDPAIERAGLLGAFVQETGLPALHPKVGLLTGEEPLDDEPWLTTFKLVEVLPWRVAKVRRWLHEHRGGIVEVKTRGGVVNTDEVQKRLRGGGDIEYTVFVLRFDRQVYAIVTRRLDQI